MVIIKDSKRQGTRGGQVLEKQIRHSAKTNELRFSVGYL
jgi:hypothetical protein